MTKFRIKELAKERGMTVDDLVRTSGIKHSTLQRIWQGRTDDPGYSTMRAIARALNVRMEDLEELPGNRVPAPRAAVIAA